MANSVQYKFSELDDAVRHNIKQKVLRQLHRSGMITALDIQTSGGMRPLIVAFEDESVGDIIQQASWTEGRANLVVLMEDRYRVAFMALHPSSVFQTIYAKTWAQQLHLTLDSEVGMLVHAAENAQAPLELAFEGTPGSQFDRPEFVEMGELVTG